MGNLRQETYGQSHLSSQVRWLEACGLREQILESEQNCLVTIKPKIKILPVFKAKVGTFF